MKRWLLVIGLLLVSTLAFGADITEFYKLFQPSKQDLSVWYLGNIFGAELVPGDKISGVRLLSVLFGIFNQVALTVGIIIIVYSALAGTLNTAHEGKPLGEKWNSMWMPVRISVGIALLVPKGGTGYCLAQSLVMWLTLQGIGAADTVWNSMIDYFAQGGAIYSNETAQTQAYMTPDNAEYAYALEGAPDDLRVVDDSNLKGRAEARLLKNMVCVALFNNDPDAVTLNEGHKYETYTLSGVYDTVYFGDRRAGIDGTGGSECGAVTATADSETCPTDDDGMTNCMNNRNQVYTNANWNMAKGLERLAKEIVVNPTNTNDTWSAYDTTVKQNAELYINYLVGYEDVLYDKKAASGALEAANAFEVYKKYGWILAGNYYTILSGFKERVDYVTRTFRPASFVTNSVKIPIPDIGSDADKAYKNIDSYFEGFADDADPGSIVVKADATKTRAAGSKKSASQRKIGPVSMEEIYKALGASSETASGKKSKDKHAGKKAKDKGKKGKRSGGGGKKSQSAGATRRMVEDYLRYLTGEGSGTGDLRVAKDPILRAANYGKDLTIAALALLPVIALLMTIAALFHACDAASPGGAAADVVAKIAGVPLIALFVFMYTQGAILGVFIPLIPYVTFFIGVVGWMLQVVEAVAAAPLVAIGLVFPETRDDIWGRAAPAYMLILGLFLRPSLMLVGFAAAMMVLWVLTELLNIGFLMLTAATFRIEDVFGFVVIMMAYTGIFTVVVTKSYSLINVVPNKVLSWIGDSSMGVGGTEEAISAAKGGVEAGAGAVGGGLHNQGDTAGASKSAKDFGDIRDKQQTDAKAGGDKDAKRPGIGSTLGLGGGGKGGGGGGKGGGGTPPATPPPA